MESGTQLGQRVVELTTSFTTVSCSCGGVYALPERYVEKKREVGGSWTCPYCKVGWGYSGKSQIEELSRELARERAGRPLIYASMGTLQNRLGWVFRVIAEACAELDSQLVMSFGGSAMEIPNRQSRAGCCCC